MGLIRSFTRVLERAASSVLSSFGRMSLFGLGGVMVRGLRDSLGWLQAFRRNPRLRSAVRRIARDVARVPVHLSMKGTDGKPQRINTGSAFLNWLREPWKMLRGGTWQSWATLMVIWYCLVGNAFAVYGRDSKGLVVEAVPVAPHQVKPVRLVFEDGTPPEIVFDITPSGGGAPIRVPGSEVFWWRDADAIDPLEAGTGQAQCLDDELELDEAAAKYNLSYFRNSATPHVLVTAENATAEELKKLKADWRERHQGALNAFRSAFTSRKISVESIGQSQRDMEYVAGRKFSRDAIYQTFNLPPEIMGIVENSNRATADAALYIYSLHITLPHIDELCAEVSRQILPQVDARPGLFLAYENPVRETEEFKLRKATELFKCGAITRDECRVTNGYDPVGGLRGGEYLVPTNTATLDANTPAPELDAGQADPKPKKPDPQEEDPDAEAG